MVMSDASGLSLPKTGRLCGYICKRSVQCPSLSPVSEVVPAHPGEHCSCLEIPLKTEFVTTLSKKYKEKTGRELKFHFDDL